MSFHVSKILAAALCIVNLSAVPTLAQSVADQAKSELSGMYGLYQIGDFCVTQGHGFTATGLENIKKAALPYEQQLDDEKAEAELWEASAQESSFVLAMMASDTDIARLNCGQLNVIVGALSAQSSTEKPF